MVNNVSKDMFMEAKPERQSEYIWDGIVEINNKVDTICQQPQACEQAFDKKYVTKKEVKGWKVMASIALVFFLFGAGYLGIRKVIPLIF